VGNQARLKDIAVLLNKDINNLVQEADQISDLLELIDQDIPLVVKASLESAAHLDDYFAMVRKANKNISSRATLQNNMSLKKQEAKELHSQIQNALQEMCHLLTFDMCHNSCKISHRSPFMTPSSQKLIKMSKDECL
jgi:hypothetical protein